MLGTDEHGAARSDGVADHTAVEKVGDVVQIGDDEVIDGMPRAVGELDGAAAPPHRRACMTQGTLQRRTGTRDRDTFAGLQWDPCRQGPLVPST